MKFLNIEHIIANKYNHLLAMLILLLLFSPFFDANERAIGFKIITIILLATIIICLRVTVRSLRIFWLCVAIAAAALLLDGAANRIANEDAKHALATSTTLIYAFFVALTIIALMKNMFRAKRVTPDMIVGGVCIYLLLGIFWMLLYDLVGTFDEGAITSAGRPSHLYFSFTTLTTLGYGDFIPTTEFARALTSLEAISGQMYLAVFVARLVGLHIAHEIKQTNK